MASSSLVLSEEQFQCSVCLNMFTEPVSIPCGHNYCKACIRKYWETTDLCLCPMCKEIFHKKPALRVNTFISEMVAQFKALAPVEYTPISPGQAQTTNLREVPCDVCPKGECKALKSCLVCLASYCEPHLDHHRIVSSLKKHKLIDPVPNLEERVCKKHERPLELFCRNDLMCVCQFCTEADHKTHDTVPMEEELEKRKAEMERTRRKVQKIIQERQQEVKKIMQAVELSKKDAEREMADGVQAFTALMLSIEKHQAEVLQVIQYKQKAAERQAECLIEELEHEITELKERSTELEQLSNTDDHLLLRSPPSFCTSLPCPKKWSKINIHHGVYVGTLRRAASQLEETLNKEMERFCDAELKRAQQ
ncbi:E3 ubiquitin-protein ligase TRIM47-like [Esox lucius]|uniref:E3 ubiquitin-protein ligase TRIM47-like n=1 Tax=Esox lucius TaxID=8010 RepID=UPI0014774883|nr:E3 ubiquitin-protein ligase TRIM47-like [Esox lucius]